MTNKLSETYSVYVKNEKENKTVNVLAYFSGKVASQRRILNSLSHPFHYFSLSCSVIFCNFIYQTEVFSGTGFNLGDTEVLVVFYAAYEDGAEVLFSLELLLFSLLLLFRASASGFFALILLSFSITRAS